MSARFDGGRALLVGITDYELLNKLPPAVLNDINDFADTLDERCGYPAQQVRTLRNRQATNNALRQALREFAAECNPEDTAVFVFSGHGERIEGGPGTGSYLCPVNFDPSRPQETGITRDEFSSMLAAVPARRLWVVLDACHSAGSVSFKASGETINLKAGLSDTDFSRLANGAGRVLFASSREDEYSMILGGMRNSLFSHHVLAGLRGDATREADGTIGVLDLFKYVSREVCKESQHAVMKADLESNFPIALGVAPKSIVPKSGIPASGTEEWWKLFEKVAIDLYPFGPQDGELWSRADCNLSGLRPNLAGRAAWHSAMRMLKQGSGGIGASERLLSIMLEDFPSSAALLELEAKPR